MLNNGPKGGGALSSKGRFDTHLVNRGGITAAGNLPIPNVSQGPSSTNGNTATIDLSLFAQPNLSDITDPKHAVWLITRMSERLRSPFQRIWIWSQSPPRGEDGDSGSEDEGEKAAFKTANNLGTKDGRMSKAVDKAKKKVKKDDKKKSKKLDKKKKKKKSKKSKKKAKKKGSKKKSKKKKKKYDSSSSDSSDSDSSSESDSSESASSDSDSDFDIATGPNLKKMKISGGSMTTRFETENHNGPPIIGRSSTSSSLIENNKTVPATAVVVKDSSLVEHIKSTASKVLRKPKSDDDSSSEDGPLPAAWRGSGAPGAQNAVADSYLANRKAQYGKALLPGEGEAIANFAKEGKRIPRRGEVGISAEDIEKLENVGFVMSGNRHKRMNAIRMRKENQVLTAEEEKMAAVEKAEARKQKEVETVQELKTLVLKKKEQIEDDKRAMKR